MVNIAGSPGDYFTLGNGDVFSGNLTNTPVPVPGALWLLGSGFIGLLGFRKRFGS